MRKRGRVISSLSMVTQCKKMRTAQYLVAVVACGAMFGCSSAPAPSATSGQVTLVSPVVSSESQVLPPEQVQAAIGPSEPENYLLGAGDVIAISVYNHPELSIPSTGTSGGVNGVLVTNDGTIDLPLIGNVNVAGMTIEQAQRAISKAYNADVVMPDVTLQLVEAQSLRYYLLGDFTTPGVKYPGRRMTLLDALALGGSVDIASADLYQAYVTKGAVKVPVDLHALLVDGDMSQNITLDPGTVIVVPPSTAENAFVFGAVGKAGAVPFQSGSLSLLGALSIADLDLSNYSAASLSDVHVIRSHGQSAEFFVVDAAKTLSGQASMFALEPGDIVFVPPNGIASWNQVLDMLLPSLNTIGGVLNPFVQIKYLSQKNP